jgi:8-oxo-dGTP pyrophosphatase MutT (NUDIX family)
MRIRAGIILIQDGRVALIERHRAGLDYFVFPGGGVDDGESVEQAAIREALEELGIGVAIKQKVAEVQLGEKSRQVYFLVEQTGGEFGSGLGEEYTDSDPASPEEGIYVPIWMPIDQLPLHANIYPADLARMVVRSVQEGWSRSGSVLFEERK